MTKKEWSFKRNFFIYGSLLSTRSRLNQIATDSIILDSESKNLRSIIAQLDQFVLNYKSEEFKKESKIKCKVEEK